MSAPGWFRAAIAQGLVRLVALSLPGTPPADTIALTREAWIEALWKSQSWTEGDAARIEEGFALLSARVERWPAPAQLLAALPPRALPRALPEPPPDPETRRRIAQMISALRARLTTPPAKRPPSR